MPEITDAQKILAAIGMPHPQQSEIAALTLLALCGLKPADTWVSAQRSSMTVSKGIMVFIREVYGREYTPNMRETFRRQVLQHFVSRRIADYNPDDPSLPANSPRAHFAISDAALAVIRTYKTERWNDALTHFNNINGNKSASRQPVTVTLSLADGGKQTLSLKRHNQAQVIERFVPQFAAASHMLYVGDKAEGELYKAADQLAKLNIPATEPDKLPDILLYIPARNSLILVDVSASHGAMTARRHDELNALFKDCSVPKIFVSAFPTFSEFRRQIRNVAWETSVWIAEVPEHLIHFDGDHFLQPHE